jgi:hypothetical protein
VSDVNFDLTPLPFARSHEPFCDNQQYSNRRSQLNPKEAARFRRRVLEELPKLSETSPAKPFLNYRYLPGANLWSADAVLSQLEILASEGRVELKRMADECAVKITPLGRRSLEVMEDEWQTNVKPVVNTSTLNITNSQTGNVAQMTGSHGSTINQSEVSNDLSSVLAAIDRMMATVKNSPALRADVKKDAQIEADQLKGEINKSEPNPNRVKEALEWFETAAGAVEVIPKLADVWEKVKIFLPGVF